MRRWLVLLVVAAATAGCGLGAQENDRTIAAGDVPYELLAQPTTTTTEPPPPTTTTTLPWRTDLWFVERDRIVPVPRQLRTEPTVEVVLDLLLHGPLGFDGRLVRSALSSGDAIAASAPADGQLIVDLADHFGARSPSEQVLALGQLVWSLTEVPGVGRVVFRISGSELAVPLPDGQLAQRPVSRDDYATLVFPF